MTGGPDLLERIAAVNVWQRRDERAPHKPLLLLYVLGRCSRGLGSEVPYAEVDEALGKLLRDFGPPRQSFHPEYPFWWLRTDGLWVVESEGELQPRKSGNNPPKGELLRKGAIGHLPAEDEQLLKAHPELIRTAAREILERNFPETFHEDILAAVGLELGTDGTGQAEREDVSRRRRDRRFRDRVLQAYERRCAVCGAGIRLGDTLVGVEAAHIKWHQAGGPDTEPNGLALCSLHHKLFDRGAFTLFEGGTVRVSERANGETGMEDWLLRFQGADVRRPVREEYLPDPGFLWWHREQVFLGPARA
ncbi:HNH endonuclease [bacterium]|nr:HNH endonuclease [bacterium]